MRVVGYYLENIVKNRNLLILLCLMLLGSCSMFEHRDYSDVMSEYQYDEPVFRANQDFMIVSGDSGRDYRLDSEVQKRTPASAEQAHISLYEASLRRELKHLEFRLTEDEYYEFNSMRDRIGSVSEQIYYLRLNHVQREEYLMLRKIKMPTPRNSRGYSAYGPKRVAFYQQPVAPVATDDVTLGMSRERVMQNWGNPVKREIAGNPTSGNERWAFKRDGKVRYIYFESGVVQGWSQAE